MLAFASCRAYCAKMFSSSCIESWGIEKQGRGRVRILIIADLEREYSTLRAVRVAKQPNDFKMADSRFHNDGRFSLFLILFLSFFSFFLSPSIHTPTYFFSSGVSLCTPADLKSKLSCFSFPSVGIIGGPHNTQPNFLWTGLCTSHDLIMYYRKTWYGNLYLQFCPLEAEAEGSLSVCDQPWLHCEFLMS